MEVTGGTRKEVFTEPDNMGEPGWPIEGEENSENQNQKVDHVRRRILPLCVCSSTVGGVAGGVVWLAGASGPAVAATVAMATLIILSSVLGRHFCRR